MIVINLSYWTSVVVSYRFLLHILPVGASLIQINLTRVLPDNRVDPWINCLKRVHYGIGYTDSVHAILVKHLLERRDVEFGVVRHNFVRSAKHH